MTHTDFDQGTATLVRAADAEVIGFLPQMIRLLADSSSTGGRLSAQRVTLAGGAGGANPHHHANSAELFYVLTAARSGSSETAEPDRKPERKAMPVTDIGYALAGATGLGIIVVGARFLFAPAAGG